MAIGRYARGDICKQINLGYRETAITTRGRRVSRLRELLYLRTLPATWRTVSASLVIRPSTQQIAPLSSSSSRIKRRATRGCSYKRQNAAFTTTSVFVARTRGEQARRIASPAASLSVYRRISANDRVTIRQKYLGRVFLLGELERPRPVPAIARRQSVTLR